MGKGRKSLRDLLFSYSLFASIVPLVILSAAAIFFVRERLKTDIQEENRIMANSMARETDTFLQEVDSVERWLISYLEPKKMDPPRIEKLLRVTREEFPFFESLQILNGEGVVEYVAPSNSDLHGSSMINQRYFYVPSITGGTYWSSSFTSSVSGTPTIAVSRNLGTGVLVGYINLDRLEILHGDNHKIGRQRILITDSRGTALVYPDRELISRHRNFSSHPVVADALRGKTGTFETEFGGEEVLCSTALIESTGWPVVVLQSRRNAYLVLRYVLATGLGLALFSALLSVVLSHYGRRRILAPLNRMNEVLSNISSGDYGESRLSREQSYPELERVIDSMEEMSGQVELREEELRQKEQKYRELVQNAASIIIRWNAEFKITFFNEYAERYWGISAGQMVGRKLIDIILPAVAGDGKPIEEHLSLMWENPWKYASFQFTHSFEGKNETTISWSNRPITDEEGRVTEILSVGADITDITETRKELENSLKEKELLLKEVHHRVKNNLQLILSMLNLKFGHSLDRQDEQHLYESMGHIYAIAQVHEQLYQSDDFTGIDFQEYLRQVVAYILNTETYRRLDVQLEIDVGGVHLDIDRAIPVGLTVFELVSNSLSHADFPQGEGKISIHGEYEGKGVRITVQDNGPGFDAALFENPETFGFTMTGELMKQLGGTIVYSGDAGSRFDINFSLDDTAGPKAPDQMRGSRPAQEPPTN